MDPSFSHYAHYRSPRSKRLVLPMVVALHVALLALLLANKTVQLSLPLEALAVTIYDINETVKPQNVIPKTIYKPSAQPLSIIATTEPDVVAVTVPAINPSSPSEQNISLPSAPTHNASPVAETPPRFDASYLNNPAPSYPPVSKKRHEQGVAILRVHVEPDGLPAEVLLHRSSGFDALDEAALKAVRRWKFVPAKQGETLVSAWVLVPVAFSLTT